MLDSENLNKKLEEHAKILVEYIQKEFNEKATVFKPEIGNKMLTCMITSYNISFVISINPKKDNTDLPVLSIFFNYMIKPSFSAECILNLIKEKILTKFLILNIGDNGFTNDGKFITGEKLEEYITNNIQNQFKSEKALDDMMKFTNIDKIPSC